MGSSAHGSRIDRGFVYALVRDSYVECVRPICFSNCCTLMLPEWAPNLHPMIVHFPLALLFVAVAADVLSFALRRWSWLRPASVALYVLGGASAIVTYFTGTWAAESVRISAEVEPLLGEHANLGWWTMWFFGLYALVRLGAQWHAPTRDRPAVQGALCVVALLGLYLPWEAGEHGAQMVYQYGVGVQAAQSETTQQPAMQAPDAAGFMMGADGWTWMPRTPAAWTQHTTWMGRPSGEMRTRLVDTDDGGRVLSLRMEQAGRVFFVVPDTLDNVQVEARIDPSQFGGDVLLLHHVQNAQTYDYLALRGNTMQIGRVQDGTSTVLDEAPLELEAAGWITVRATGDGEHFRGYVDDQMMVHGHTEPLPPGRAGMGVNGQGPVLIQRLQARRITP